MNDYIEVKTVENTTIRLQKSNIGAIEEIPATARSEGYLKVYVGGFSFHIRATFDEIKQLLSQK